MAQLRGHLIKDGETTDWHPIEVEEISPGKFALLVSGGTGSGSSGVPEHHNANANTASATVNFSGTIKHVQITNRSTTDTIFVSFDAGVNTKTIDSGETLDVDATITSLDISASVDGTPYEIIALV